MASRQNQLVPFGFQWHPNSTHHPHNPNSTHHPHNFFETMGDPSNEVVTFREVFILIVLCIVTFGYTGATISVIVRDATHGDGDTESLMQNIFSIILSGLGIPAIALFSMFMHKIFTGRFDKLETANTTLIEGNATLIEGNSTLVKKIEDGNTEITGLLRELIRVSTKPTRGTRDDDFFLSRMDKKVSQREFCSNIGSVNSAEEQQGVIDVALRSGLDKHWVYGTACEMGKFLIHPKSG